QMGGTTQCRQLCRLPRLADAELGRTVRYREPVGGWRCQRACSVQRRVLRRYLWKPGRTGVQLQSPGPLLGGRQERAESGQFLDDALLLQRQSVPRPQVESVLCTRSARRLKGSRGHAAARACGRGATLSSRWL